jgi:hypothetical protein
VLQFHLVLKYQALVQAREFLSRAKKAGALSDSGLSLIRADAIKPL